MRLKNALLSTIAAALIACISFSFWEYTIKDYRPTPLPTGYKPVSLASYIPIKSANSTEKPVLLHFFNPNCPCSRFNLDHVRKLIKTYNKEIEVKMVLQVSDSLYDWRALKEDIAIDVLYLIDSDGALAKAYGVYATPQAVLLTPEQTLYFRGNYNRARYCTNPGSNFAQMAIDSLLANRPIPEFEKPAIQAYGCTLPQKQFSYAE